MGYSHGRQWDDERIEKEILSVMEKAGIETMPTHALMNEITHSCALSVAISKHGGTAYWAKKMDLGIKASESYYGYQYEQYCKEKLISLGYDCEKMKERYPYDLTANKHIKIDVKASNLYCGGHGNFYSFNLEKSNPTCDIFVCFCVDGNMVKKAYIIPSCLLHGITQLSIGEKRSKYDKFIENWDLFEEYDDFYKRIACNYI